MAQAATVAIVRDEAGGRTTVVVDGARAATWVPRRRPRVSALAAEQLVGAAHARGGAGPLSAPSRAVDRRQGQLAGSPVVDYYHGRGGARRSLRRGAGQRRANLSGRSMRYGLPLPPMRSSGVDGHGSRSAAPQDSAVAGGAHAGATVSGSCSAQYDFSSDAGSLMGTVE